MPKLTGPCMNLEARGTLARILSFVKTARGTVCRKRPVPADPQTQAQLYRRTMFSFLQKNWADVSPPRQTSWKILATEAATSPNNAYVSTNLARWHNFLTPSEYIPVEQIGQTGIIQAWKPEQFARRIRIRAHLATLFANWGCIIYLSASSMPDHTVDHVLHVGLLNTTSPTFFWHVPTWPGMHYFRFSIFSDNGKRLDHPTQRTVDFV